MVLIKPWSPSVPIFCTDFLKSPDLSSCLQCFHSTMKSADVKFLCSKSTALLKSYSESVLLIRFSLLSLKIWLWEVFFSEILLEHCIALFCFSGPVWSCSPPGLLLALSRKILEDNFLRKSNGIVGVNQVSGAGWLLGFKDYFIKLLVVIKGRPGKHVCGSKLISRGQHCFNTASSVFRVGAHLPQHSLFPSQAPWTMFGWWCFWQFLFSLGS